jgi:hypothetical protein
MSGLIDGYLTHYENKKLSEDREKSILEGIRSGLGRGFVREVDGVALQRWYENLTKVPAYRMVLLPDTSRSCTT